MFYRANERQRKLISLGELGAAGRCPVSSTVRRIPSGLPVIRPEWMPSAEIISDKRLSITNLAEAKSLPFG